ncbi:AsnC family protein [Cutibacterium acnes]|nr:AsnC family protein [Cutibacterium acnes]
MKLLCSGQKYTQGLVDRLEGIDDIDLKIISFLQEDGRITFKEIAQNILLRKQKNRPDLLGRLFFYRGI